MKELGSFSLILVTIMSIYLWYSFNNGCEGNLKIAGDAPNIEMADEYLGKALDYMDSKKLIQGNSSFIFDIPKNDIGIWHKKISGAKETTGALLEKIKKDPNSVSQLEKDNALMKIREVVLDESSSGVEVTLPEGISWHPHRWAMTIWWLLSACITAIGLFVPTNKK